MVVADRLPGKLPRASTQRNWRQDSQLGAQVNPIPPFKAPLIKSPDELVGSPLGGIVTRLDWMLGAATKTFADVMQARVIEKPGTLVNALAQRADQGIDFTKARMSALQNRVKSGVQQTKSLRPGRMM